MLSFVKNRKQKLKERDQLGGYCPRSGKRWWWPGLDGGRADGEKGINLRHVLEVNWQDSVGMGCGRREKGEIRDGSHDFGFANW